MPAAELRSVLDGLDLDLRPFDADGAYIAGDLRRDTRGSGFSLGDRACRGLAVQPGGVALTADAAWAKLSLDRVNVALIR